MWNSRKKCTLDWNQKIIYKGLFWREHGHTSWQVFEPPYVHYSLKSLLVVYDVHRQQQGNGINLSMPIPPHPIQTDQMPHTSKRSPHHPIFPLHHLPSHLQIYLFVSHWSARLVLTLLSCRRIRIYRTPYWFHQWQITITRISYLPIPRKTAYSCYHDLPLESIRGAANPDSSTW